MSEVLQQTEPRHTAGHDSFKILGEIEMTQGVFSFHQWLATELLFDDSTAYVSFVMQDYARLLLKDNHKRLGELVAEAQIHGHCIQESELVEVG